MNGNDHPTREFFSVEEAEQWLRQAAGDLHLEQIRFAWLDQEEERESFYRDVDGFYFGDVVRINGRSGVIGGKAYLHGKPYSL